MPSRICAGPCNDKSASAFGLLVVSLRVLARFCNALFGGRIGCDVCGHIEDALHAQALQKADTFAVMGRPMRAHAAIRVLRLEPRNAQRDAVHPARALAP